MKNGVSTILKALYGMGDLMFVPQKKYDKLQKDYANLLMEYMQLAKELEELKKKNESSYFG